MKTTLSLLRLALFATFCMAAGANAPPTLSLNFTNVGTSKAFIHWSLPSQSINATPPSISFGTVTVGKSTSFNLTLENDGAVPLSLPAISISGANPGDFSAASQCPQFLAVNAQCTIVTTFAPTATGSRTASLNVPFSSAIPDAVPSLHVILTQKQADDRRSKT